MEAADMVLLDSFSAIVVAIENGRLVFDNLERPCLPAPSRSFSELWPYLERSRWFTPNTVIILDDVICLFTDCAGSMTLVYEKPEADVLIRPPRNPKKDHLVDWKLLLHAYAFIGILECLCAMAISFWFLQTHGAPFSVIALSFEIILPVSF